MSQPVPKRWIILFAGMLINICIGANYSWSVYQKPLMEVLQASTSEVSLAFTISLGTLSLAMILGGKIQDNKGPRLAILTGGILYGLGLVGAGFSSNLPMLYVTYGAMGGTGIGMIYSCIIANTVKFFPDKPGLAAGLVVGGFGAGAAFVAPISAWLLEQYSVLTVFKILGASYIIIISLCAAQIKAAPAQSPAGAKPAGASGTIKLAQVDKNWRQMMADPLFYVIFMVHILGALSGLMLMGHVSPIAQEVIKVTPALAAATVGFVSLANSGGRIFWGWASDRAGCYNVIYVLLITTALMLFWLTNISSYVPFVIALMSVVFCFGGLYGVLPCITVDTFGPKNLGMNYGIIFAGYGAAALAGPRLAARVKEVNAGDYSLAFIIAGGLSLLGIIFCFMARRMTKRRAEARLRGQAG